MPQSADSGLDFLRGPLLFGGVIGALALGWVASGQQLPWQHDSKPQATQGVAGCSQTTRVSVAVAPAIYEPVVAALDRSTRSCVDVEATKQTATDVARLAEAGLAGCIIGRALYEGTLALADALRVSQTPLTK